MLVFGQTFDSDLPVFDHFPNDRKKTIFAHRSSMNLSNILSGRGWFFDILKRSKILSIETFNFLHLYASITKSECIFGGSFLKHCVRKATASTCKWEYNIINFPIISPHILFGHVLGLRTY